MKTTYLFIRPLVYLFLILLLASCTVPQAVVRMNPVSTNVRWNYGQAYASDTLTGIIVEAAFDKSTPEYNIFDVSIINGSNMSYLVDPDNFTIKEVNQSSSGRVYHAVNPERMLLSLDKHMSQEVADAKNAAVGAGVVLGALVVASVAIAIADDGHDDYRVSDPDIMLAAPVIIDAVNHSTTCDYVASDDQRRDMWACSTVRKTTLEPGYRVSGKVFFHRFVKAGPYVLKLKVDGGFVEIPFTQVTYYP